MPKVGQIPSNHMTSIAKNYHEDLSYDPSISSGNSDESYEFQKLTNPKEAYRGTGKTDSTRAGSLRSSHRKTTFLKVVMIGDSNVGKTTLIESFQYKKVNKIQRPTIGADFMKKIVTLSSGKQVPLQIWDTAGQERFQSLSNTFYRGTDCCVIVFDLNNMKSYERITTWRNNFVESQGYDEMDESQVPIIIVGNKTDLAEHCREVSVEQVLQEWIYSGLANNYIETSAFSSQNVDECFNIVAEEARSYQISTQDNLNNRQDLHTDIMQQLVNLQKSPIQGYSGYSDDSGGSKFSGITMEGEQNTSASSGSESDNNHSDESGTPPGYKHNKKFKLNNNKHRLSHQIQQPGSSYSCCYFV